MATKSQRFRAEQQRSGPKRPPSPRQRPRNQPVDTALPGISASDRRVGVGGTAARNRSQAAGRKASYELENSTNGQPSRKSSRKSRNRQKPDSNLKRRQTRTISSPAQRARQR